MAKKAESKAEQLFPDAFQLAANVEYFSAHYGTRSSDLMKAARISESTLRKRRHEPWTWTLDELTGLARLWNLRVPQLMVAPRFDPPEGAEVWLRYEV